MAGEIADFFVTYTLIHTKRDDFQMIDNLVNNVFPKVLLHYGLNNCP
jgi:hypothetical protein